MCEQSKITISLISNLVLLLAISSFGVAEKIWKRNTNFGNEDNWEGFTGLCGKTIYSFDAWLNPTVVSFPVAVSAKQILLPNNGYFVLQSVATTFSDFDNATRASCLPRETKFKRNKPADWFDPSNWKDSLEPDNEAVSHVQRVPCGYDSVKFMENSSFSVLISTNVAIRKFFVGDKSFSYADVGLFMSTNLGQIQFKKKAETEFMIGKNKQNCEDDTMINDDCICENYEDSKKRHICSLVECKSVEENCPTPITPHGFCCSICGYHVRIQHRPGFSLKDLKEKVNMELKALKGSVDFYTTVYKKNGVHVVFIPQPNSTALVYKAVQVIRAYLQQQTQVVEVSVGKSWEHLDDTDKDSSSGSGPVLSLIILTIILVLGGLACLIFYWKKTGYPSIALTWPTCPSMSRIQLPSRLIGSDSTPSFAFARFSNERISHLNLGHTFEGSLARTEAVDEPAGETTTTGNQGASSEVVSVAFSSEGNYDTVVTPQDIMGKTDSVTLCNDEHVYDLIEVTEDSAAVLTSSTDNLVSTTEE